jgi:hypothetical protein
MCQIIEDFSYVGVAQPSSMQPFVRGADEVLDPIDIFIMNFRYEGDHNPLVGVILVVWF